MNIETLKLAVLTLAASTAAQADPFPDTHWSDERASVWIKESFVAPETLKTVLTPALDQVGRSYLMPLLPTIWGIWIDGTWTRTSGYWGENLRTPDGRPAILITPSAAVDPVLAPAVLAHEVTHLVHHRLHPREEAWVREGVALLAEYRVTGRQNPAFRTGWTKPEASLTAALDAASPEYHYGAAQGAQYGALAQFFYFIYKNCGQDFLLAELLADEAGDLRGPAFVDAALSRTGRARALPAFCGTFRDAFTQFQVARFTQDPTRRHYFLTVDPERAARRPSPPASLAPFAAAAYARPTKGCGPDLELTEGPACLRVRLD
jgi:hypothetical protein